MCRRRVASSCFLSWRKSRSRSATTPDVHASVTPVTHVTSAEALPPQDELQKCIRPAGYPLGARSLELSCHSWQGMGLTAGRFANGVAESCPASIYGDGRCIYISVRQTVALCCPMCGIPLLPFLIVCE
jgi:hypothetical protein